MGQTELQLPAYGQWFLKDNTDLQLVDTLSKKLPLPLNKKSDKLPCSHIFKVFKTYIPFYDLIY